MVESGTFRIRPAGRHILTIGRDLVQDPHAAVIELVKNAYDADSPDVIIAFEHTNTGEYHIRVLDQGHGMTRDTVVNQWMVPSTSDKENRKGRSPGGRKMQGRKGIGRFAASILGEDLLLETVTTSGEKTTLYLQWDDFNQAERLEDVEVLIDTRDVKESAGTTLTIRVSEKDLEAWKESQFTKLHFELKKLMPPFPNMAPNQSFNVVMRVAGIPGVADQCNRIEPFPVVEYFDYRIAGKINENGKGSLMYSQQKSRNTPEHEISIDIGKPSLCGVLDIDVRVYDREDASLDQLIQRGLKNEKGQYLKKLDLRRLLNEYNGIGVYRNGFRLRPLGDPDFDWLKLDERRVQNPSQRIGNNQVIGYVQIQSEEQSQLIEKSARDGLIENEAFQKMKEITKTVIGKLEEKRFQFRKQSGLGRPTIKIKQELDKLYSSDELLKGIRSALSSARVNRKVAEQVSSLIEDDERNKLETALRLRDAIAVYQGHATLGKIINVVLHEGRRPLSYFRNYFPLLHKAASQFEQSQDPKFVPKIIDYAQGIAENANQFVILFRRLDPLAAQRRSRRKLEALVPMIRRAIQTFSKQLREASVTCSIHGDEKFKFLCWNQDIIAIFTNLVDNSLYWLLTTKSGPRCIDVTLTTQKNELVQIDFTDTGPGIDSNNIESGIIFDPQFSTKPDGTGLGLAIAGEAASRNSLELKALKSADGAWFRLQPFERERTEKERKE